MILNILFSSLRSTLYWHGAVRTAHRSLNPLTRTFHASSNRHKHFLDVDAKTFAETIAERSKERVVLVDFYADWCGPCKVISPILEKLTAEGASKTGSGKELDLVTVDTDTEGELAAQHQVRALPTVLAFKDGKVVDQFVGAVPEGHLKAFIQKL